MSAMTSKYDSCTYAHILLHTRALFYNFFAAIFQNVSIHQEYFPSNTRRYVKYEYLYADFGLLQRTHNGVDEMINVETQQQLDNTYTNSGQNACHHYPNCDHLSSGAYVRVKMEWRR